MISGGGTGGHIFPAIAIANALKRKNPAIEILFVGAEGRMEMEKIPNAGYNIVGLPIAGLQRKLSAKNFLLPFKIVRSMLKANGIISRFKPHVTVGVGGYASGPVVFLSSLRGMPTLIQEQNSYAGITNKILGKRAKKICVAYENMERFFSEKKIIVTGNPVRKDLKEMKISRDEALSFFGLKNNLKTILVIGGSLGSRTLNESVKQNLKEIKHQEIQLIWQTGKNYFEGCKLPASDYKDRIKVFDFIQRMDCAYAAADVVISRAGALSISELCVVKKPSVLVPSPNVTEDHQTKNAMALVNKNAAILVKDEDAKEKLIDATINLLNDEIKMQTMKQNLSSLAKPNADDEIAEEILKLIKA